MHLSRFTDYSLRTLMMLACHPDRTVPVSRVAEAHGISTHHLAKTARALAGAGFVETVRGRGGGLRLARRPERLRIGEVVRRLEPNLAIVECFDPAVNRCRIRGACRLQGALRSALEAFLHDLDRTTLADLVADRDELFVLLERSRNEGESR